MPKIRKILQFRQIHTWLLVNPESGFVAAAMPMSEMMLLLLLLLLRQANFAAFG